MSYNPQFPMGKQIASIKRTGGQPGLAQGTTRTLRDTLNFDGGNTYVFFESAGNRTFPQSTVDSSSKLPTNETFAIMEIRMGIYLTSTGGEIQDVQTFEEASRDDFYAGKLEFSINNSRVIKTLDMFDFKAAFNPFALNDNASFIKLRTHIIIPSLQDFKLTVTLPNAVPASDTEEFFCSLVGRGSIQGGAKF